MDLRSRPGRSRSGSRRLPHPARRDRVAKGTPAIMQLGLHLADMTFPGGAPTLGRDLAAAAKGAEDVGFSRVSVMDHLWQIEGVGPPEHAMLEAYTTLGYLAAATERVELLAWVTAAGYRQPGMLAKVVTTLDVLSGGRAGLGIGAGWYEGRRSASGCRSRCRRALRAARGVAADLPADVGRRNDGPYQGKHYQLGRTLNSPQSLQPSAPADPDRRRRREEDAADGRPVRAGLQPLRRSRTAAQARRAARALRGPSAATTTRSRRPS